MKFKRLLVLLSLVTFVSGCAQIEDDSTSSTSSETTQESTTETSTDTSSSTDSDPIDSDYDFPDPTPGAVVDTGTYYDGIGNKVGNDLLSALRSLNSSKRKSTVGYSNMGTSVGGDPKDHPYMYTDYDPSTVKYDAKGQPYGTKVVSFYSGNTMTSYNKEHVWPDSHGGNKCEADIHMPRPTIPTENGSRGNSFYVEGKKDQKNGWDPAAESFGDITYRGDSARIIFYCMLTYTGFQLVELDYHETSRKNNDNMMGRLSTMLKWNLENPTKDREQRRNSGAEYLQGNRNPFIDHPEYACRIWGNANDAAKRICKGNY